jgi:NADPH:quinone reductase-like Zn-dependent oxidoreductase
MHEVRRRERHVAARAAAWDASISKVREFADDVRDGEFVLPIGRRMPLRDAAEAHVLGEKGGVGKILLLTPDSHRFLQGDISGRITAHSEVIHMPD